MDTEENPYGTGLTFVSLVSFVSNPRIEKTARVSGLQDSYLTPSFFIAASEHPFHSSTNLLP